jgi:hypothetical protein
LCSCPASKKIAAGRDTCTAGAAIPVVPHHEEKAMTAFNIVRFRTKPGREQAFIDAHRNSDPSFKGAVKASLVKTGDRTFCLVGEWESFGDIAAARPEMIRLLDTFRDHLEDLGGGLGVTDPVSGEVVHQMP